MLPAGGAGDPQALVAWIETQPLVGIAGDAASKGAGERTIIGTLETDVVEQLGVVHGNAPLVADTRRMPRRWRQANIPPITVP